MLKTLIPILLFLIAPIGTFAQKNLDALVNRFTDGQKGVEIIYSEQRDPVTHQIIKQDNMITSKDSGLLDEILKAINLDRQSAISYSKVDNDIVTVVFENNGITSTYSLIVDGKEWMFTSSKIPTKAKKAAGK
ncbi:MAG: DUF5024 domain-containing protein [Pseudoflavonifractor sp.]|nr:DUF5024 domain-containing protein [Alloprevotella sp.]MCM1117252.1 DUF5024 domain-containing protein [Pseudoflavonifractor sp.]